MRGRVLKRRKLNNYKMKSRLTAGPLVFIVFILILNPLLSQFYGGSAKSGSGSPVFNVGFFRTFSENSKLYRLYFYYEVLNDNLTFIKKGTSGFSARFDLISAIYDDEKNLIVTKSRYKEVIENDYRATNSLDKKIHLNNYYDLPSGEYLLKFKMNDLNSNKSTTQQVEIEIKDFYSKKIAMSDIIFVQNLPLDSDSVCVPSKFTLAANNNFPARTGDIYIYFDFFTQQIGTEIEINYQLQNKKNKTEIDTTIVKKIDEPITGHYLKIDKELFTSNRYTCIINIKDGKDRISSKNSLTFFWIRIPQTDNDLSAALEQMIYIMPSDSLDKYEDASKEEQKEFFIAFWKERDPNPHTEVNELMEEYFRRVNFANQKFRAMNSPGWRTDRGRILIKFGDPDEIERHPFEVDSMPYEIWRYYGLRRIFVFVDQSGFGDYRIAPEYLDQEYK